eukprot:COSAG04_NODE_4686_length_1948_cov_13.827064_3_plen_198_part_00
MEIATGSEEEDESGYQTAEEDFGCEPEPEPESVERRLAAPAEVRAMDELLRRLKAEGWLDSRRERGREAARMFEAFGGRDKCLIRFLRAYHFADLPRSFAQLTASVDFRLGSGGGRVQRASVCGGDLAHDQAGAEREHAKEGADHGGRLPQRPGRVRLMWMGDQQVPCLQLDSWMKIDLQQALRHYHRRLDSTRWWT